MTTQNAKKGYYSLIQFCPDASRMETVNLGVVLLCPDASFIAAKTAAGNRRAEKLVEKGSLDRAALNSAKRAIERRLEVDREALISFQSLERFVHSRGNALRLTEPRPVKVFDPQEELDRLFDELVGGRSLVESRRARKPPVIPELDSTFARLAEAGRARLDVRVQVPLLDRELQAPYAYRNGACHLVKPQRFSTKETPAMNSAMRLAVEGDLIQRLRGGDDGPMRLTVVALFEGSGSAQSVAGRARELFAYYDVNCVLRNDISRLVSQIEAEARPDDSSATNAVESAGG